MTRKGRMRLLKTGVWLLCLAPAGWVAWRFFLGDGLGANPVEEFEHWSGRSALVVLLGALAVTPLRRLTGFNDLQKVRRLVGLFAFFYMGVHFLTWLGLDQVFAWAWIGEDVAKRPFITLGFTAFLLLIPMAVTSTRGWIRRLGKTWVRIHRAVYVSAVLGVIHYLWATKADDLWPTVAGVVLVALLGLRAWWAVRKRVTPRPALPRRSRARRRSPSMVGSTR
ncbi:MAG TPA: protein-methionine-sulfoxide reductase heme-binding subunit MsrQ [Longimicrobiales bacterium]|nr:protein-methionine-sulfoxide reductase heme-binding subunit MsrQ [Longimicrobiales bacterium]